MRSVRVLFVDEAMRLGGAQQVLLGFLRHLDRSKLEPFLACSSGDVADHARIIGVPHFQVPFSSIRSIRTRLSLLDGVNTVQLAAQLLKIIKQVKPDVVFSNSIKAHVVAGLVMRRTRTPLFIRLHDHVSSFGRLPRFVLINALRRADALSCVSHEVARDLALYQGFNDKISVCYNGIELPERPNGFHFPRQRVIAAGWLLKWKGFDVLLNAAEKVASVLMDWEFVVAGGAVKHLRGVEYVAYLQKRMQDSAYVDRLHLVGPYKTLDEVACCARHCIFVLPSIQPDPLPTVVLEAGARALPIIASNLGGSKEILEDRKSGRLVAPTSEQIADAVCELARDKEARLEYGRQAFVTIQQKFSMEKYVGCLTESIERCPASMPQR